MWIESGSTVQIYYNPDSNAVNAMGTIAGGFCRDGGSLNVFQTGYDSGCADENLITTIEDCEEAFNEIGLEGYSFDSASYSDSNLVAGC
jgi:hypothetical protein